MKNHPHRWVLPHAATTVPSSGAGDLLRGLLCPMLRAASVGGVSWRVRAAGPNQRAPFVRKP